MSLISADSSISLCVLSRRRNLLKSKCMNHFFISQTVPGNQQLKIRSGWEHSSVVENVLSYVRLMFNSQHYNQPTNQSIHK